ncbi:hypothetical protein J8F10_13820 [Gemmata sp. G18]|uniref:Uncharacterized protein n=1 Tax=Gemmata palustris TaxID=2822762 RepID=A0ABS5BRK4_9BACT|nr:hypothetical protein [Gemmata palustris]MBP3956358.1 hypothetical protein [Gemmata palustris]
MYYPNRELAPHAPTGIAFVAHEDEQPGRMPVLGISIHNWDIMRRTRS